MNKQVILTGLRATNDIHIGNYLGAILPMVDMIKNRLYKIYGSTLQLVFR